MNNKNILIFIVLLLMAGFGIAWWFGHERAIQNTQAPAQNQSAPPAPSSSLPAQPPASIPAVTTTSTSSVQASSTSGMKTYTNSDYGFEFQYPENWSFHANTFGSPFSKFNLVGASPEENGLPDPLTPSLLVNIVAPDFADRAFSNLKGINIVVAGDAGKKYEYEFENAPRISIDLPFGEYRILLGAGKQYEDVFSQILASFKFLK